MKKSLVSFFASIIFLMGATPQEEAPKMDYSKIEAITGLAVG